MRPFSVSAIIGLAGALSLSAGTVSNYTSIGPVTVPPDIAPQVDATAFVNQGVFNVSDFSGSPFQTLNTLFFTNTRSGVMSGSPGYRFDFYTNNFRLKMSNWVNQGSIEGDTWLLVASTNITSTGPLNAGPSGLIRLDGNNINLRRDGLRSAIQANTFFGGGFFNPSNYFNPSGVTDIYWGAGASNHLDNMGTLMPLNLGNFNVPNFNLPNPQSPLHQVERLFFGFSITNLISIPRLNFLIGTNSIFSTNLFQPSYSAFVYTNTLSPTSSIVQVVFVPTNSFDTNFSTQVRFSTNFFGSSIGPATAVVQFSSTDFDIVTETFNTSFVYLIDRSALGTNIALANNFFSNTRRPDTYEVARDTPFEWLFNTNGGNTAFVNTLISNPSYFSNTVPVIYGGYAAQINPAGRATANVTPPELSDPTNFPGRVEILSDAVNLDRTRIRAESTLIIKTKNLLSNHLAQVDAPVCNFDLTSLQPELPIANMVPLNVRRLTGQIAAWTGIWDNFQTVPGSTNVNRIHFHVLIVQNNLQSLTPVIVNELALHGTNILIYDSLTVNKSILLDGKSLNVIGGLNFPSGATWAATNVLNVINFTNLGVINVTQAEFQGSDRPTPYANYVNRGTNTAAAHFIRANNFDNSGCLVANGGVISLVANMASLAGAPQVVLTNFFTNFFSSTGIVSSVVFTNVVTNSFGAKLQANADVQISANSLVASNSLILAGGASPGSLILSITNSLTDGGQGAINNWLVTAGFQALQLPATNDLLATYLQSTVPANADILHIWAGRDLGPVNAGYTNNLALGKLTLDSVDSSAIHFSGASQSNALYVDYLELLNNAANYNAAFIFDTNITIYFANANVPVSKLDGSNDGHLRWVPTFAGPLSSTNMLYSNGVYYTFNIALVQSKDIDSNNNKIPNFYDPCPIGDCTNGPPSMPGAPSIALTIAIQQSTALPPRALISWNTLANGNNHLECKRSLTDTNWVTVTNFYTGPSNTRVSVSDPLSNDSLRIYRVWMEMPPR
jgi:hypothetical protein